jgi:uncharacterized protein YhaN
MKIVRLELAAFGSLRGVTLDLSRAEPCLQIVYGSNEAGKSTALRAISGLFYGIPETTPDVHSIKGPELRVGALLCDARGRELHVVRRKGRKQTLRSHAGEPLDGAEASWLTAGVAESTFRSLFGLSFATLQAGADELLGSAGDLGQSLFGAAVGGGRVRELIESLRDEADQLFRPRGQTQQLNAALKALDEAKKRSREQAMQAGAFTDQQAAIDAAQLDDERLKAERVALRTERHRLERARRVIPLLQKRAELLRERSTLSDVVRLPADAPDERRRVENQRREAVLRIEHVAVEVARLERELSALEVPQELAELEPSVVDALRDRLGGYRRSSRELPRRREALARAQHEVTAVLSRLGMAQVPADLERLRLPKQHEARIREQARLGEALERDGRELLRARATKHDELERQRHMLTQLWAAGSASPEELPLLTRFALPRDETAEEFERAFVELEQAERALVERCQSTDAALERNLRDVAALALAGAPPTEAELTALREVRVARFSALRALWAEPEAARGIGLLDEVIALTEQCDSLSDRLRREAGRVAEHARLTADGQSVARSVRKLASERTELEQRRRELVSRWQALFQRAGIATRSPRELRGLLVEQRGSEARCEELARELAGLERDLAARAERERGWREAWKQLACEWNIGECSSAAEVDATLEVRAELFVRFDAARALERELSELERELRSFEADVRALCERHLPGSSQQHAEVAADQLIRLQQAARAALVQHQQLSAALVVRRAELAEVQAAEALATRELTLLMQAARVPDLPSLEAAELSSARAAELDAALVELQAELLAASDGTHPDAVLGALAESLDEVRARLVSTDEALEELDGACQRVAQTLASCRAGLDRLRDSHGAGDAALDAAMQLETVRSLSERYVRTRLAASVLKREVERYRERNRAPVLRAAGELFAQLTLSAFTGLDVDYAANDEPVLSCVRSNGARIGVDGLSTGTRDQLYLALRLASIQHLATKQELMPFVLDDILVHFDDDRARAALSVLGTFARTTQVLFFTHHRRLCELAAEALPVGRVRVHHLGEALAERATLYT